MKTLTFRKAQNGEYVAKIKGEEKQETMTNLSDLAKTGLMFKMLLNCSYFKAVIRGYTVYGYTDEYNNKILKYV